MARDRRASSLTAPAARQLDLDHLSEERAPSPPPRKPHVVEQLPYAERVTRWFLAREEALKKRK